MPITFDRVLEAEEAIGLEVRAGQRLRLHQVAGGQVGDIISFRTADTQDRLSMVISNFVNRTWKLTESHTLVSIKGTDLWAIEIDPVGENYSGGGYCNPALNTRRFGDPGTNSCYQNFLSTVPQFGLSEQDFNPDTCISVFMRVDYKPDGSLEIVDPSAEIGHEYVMRALEDQFVAISNCPQRRGPTNAGSLKPLGLQILE